MKTIARFSSVILALTAVVSQVHAQVAPQLTPLTTFGVNGDGSVHPGDTTPSDQTGTHALFDVLFNQRGIAYDPTTGYLVIVDAHAGQGGSADLRGFIYTVDGTTGANVPDQFSLPFVFNTTGMSNVINSGYVDAEVGVADDGVVYVCNHPNSSTAQPFKIYRWPSSTNTDPPYLCFSNTLVPGQRYGGNMDIRGSGTNTEIIIGSRANGSSGTNVVLFKTLDGTNFYSIVFGTDVTTSEFDHGIAFGNTNTFWAKHVGGSLRLLRYNLATSNAVTLRTFTSAQVQGVENLAAVAVDTNRNLLAAIEEAGGTDSGGPERVRLYDISGMMTNTNAAPILLDIKTFPVDYPNAAAPPGFLDFGGGNLYAHVINNGMRVFSTAAGAVPFPVIVDQPPPTNQVARGQTLSLTVSAYPLVTYQWRSNNVPISGATNATYTLVNIQTNYAADYICTVSNSAGATNTSDSYLVVLNLSDLKHLELAWIVGTNDAPYFNYGGNSGTPNQRTIGYSAASNHLYVASRGGVPSTISDSTSSNYVVYVVNATNGATVGKLKTDGIQNYLFSVSPTTFGIALCGIGAADDGAIYACTEAPYAYGNGDPSYTFKLYRWANESALPVKIYEGEPSDDTITNRWGDIMAVRGAGTNTQILLDINATPAITPGFRKAAIIFPTDSTMTNFDSRYFFVGSGSGTSIGRGLQFDGTNNNIWQKRKGAQLIQTSFDLNSPELGRLVDSSQLASYATFPSTLHGVAVDTTRQYAAGCDTSATAALPETLSLFFVGSFNSPVQIGSYNFKPRPNSGNANFISQTIFANNMLFALSANNGIMACKVTTGAIPVPTFVTQPQNLRLVQGNNGNLTVQTFEACTFQWQKSNGVTFTNIPSQTNATLTLTNVQFADASDYRAVATSAFSGVANSGTATVTVTGPQDNYSLLSLWSLAPGSRPYLPADTSLTGSTPLYRSIAYNGLSNQMLIVSRNDGSNGLSIHVLDAGSGADLYQLNTNGISGGSVILSSIAVSGDGSVYAGNLDSTAGGISAIYNLYRWTNSGPTTPPVLVFSGEPAGQSGSLRWGDVLDARGSGTNTEIVIDGQNNTNVNLPSFAVIFKPSDTTLNVFTNAPMIEPGGNTPLGRSLQFGSSTNIYQKRSRAPLYVRTYDTVGQTLSFVEGYGNFASTLGPVALDFTRNLLAGINISNTTNGAPDTLSLYEISDLYNPQLIAKYNFPSNAQPNANFIGQVVFAGDRVWAVDGNNGIAAFVIGGPRLNISPLGLNVLVSWGLFDGFTLQATPSVTPPVVWTNVGPGTVLSGQYVRTNSSAGMMYYRLKK